MDAPAREPAPELEAGAPSVAAVAFQGRCPRCGAPALFAGFARFAPACPRCGLDFLAFNVGDGPAAFLTLIVGTIVTAAALVVELRFSPPFWVHILLWMPLTIILVVGSLRFAKGALLALEFRNKAAEGRIDSQPPPTGRIDGQPPVAP